MAQSTLSLYPSLCLNTMNHGAISICLSIPLLYPLLCLNAMNHDTINLCLSTPLLYPSFCLSTMNHCGLGGQKFLLFFFESVAINRNLLLDAGVTLCSVSTSFNIHGLFVKVSTFQLSRIKIRFVF